MRSSWKEAQVRSRCPGGTREVWRCRSARNPPPPRYEVSFNKLQNTDLPGAAAGLAPDVPSSAETAQRQPKTITTTHSPRSGCLSALLCGSTARRPWRGPRVAVGCESSLEASSWRRPCPRTRDLPCPRKTPRCSQSVARRLSHSLSLSLSVCSLPPCTSPSLSASEAAMQLASASAELQLRPQRSGAAPGTQSPRHLVAYVSAMLFARTP